MTFCRSSDEERPAGRGEHAEDDLFGGGSITAVKSKGSLFKPSSKTLLANSDSDDDQDVTLCSAKTPVTAYINRERMLDHMKTPAELVHQTLSPMLPRPTKYVIEVKRMDYIEEISNLYQVPKGVSGTKEVGGEEEGGSTREARQTHLGAGQQEQGTGQRSLCLTHNPNPKFPR